MHTIVAEAVLVTIAGILTGITYGRYVADIKDSARRPDSRFVHMTIEHGTDVLLGVWLKV
jgi:hypothetical protein